MRSARGARRVATTRWVATTRRVATARRVLARLDAQAVRLRTDLSRGDPVLVALMRAVAERDEDELARLGVDVRYAWLDDIVAVLVAEEHLVGIETACLTAAHHLDETGRITVSAARLSDDERAGVLLAAVLREALEGCATVRLTATLDDRRDYVGGRELARIERDRCAAQFGRLLSDHDVLVRQSEAARAVDLLEERLSACERGLVEHTDDGDVTFWPTPAGLAQLALRSAGRRREFARRGIAIRRRGQPVGHAIDAVHQLTGYERGAVQIAVLDRRFAAQQDRSYALLRALDLARQETHHGVYYDTRRLTPEAIALAICELLGGALRHLLASVGRFDRWEAFDAEEYRERVYGTTILPEDREVIHFVADRLAVLAPEPADSVVDVGAGPNLYPAMLVAPYVTGTGTITLLDYAAANRDALSTALHELETHPAESSWTRFEDLMARRDPLYAGTCRRLPDLCRIEGGSVYELPEGAYDIVTSFFVAEAITTSRREFRLAVGSLARAVRLGGVLVLALVIGSAGYHAGDSTRFPSVRLQPEDIEEACRDADLEFSLHVVRHGPGDRTARAGYEGVAAVVASRVR